MNVNGRFLIVNGISRLNKEFSKKHTSGGIILAEDSPRPFGFCEPCMTSTLLHSSKLPLAVLTLSILLFGTVGCSSSDPEPPEEPRRSSKRSSAKQAKAEEAEVQELQYWGDPHLTLLEQIMPKLKQETEGLFDKANSVAISSISYDDKLPNHFRKVATARLHQVLTRLPKLKVSVCEACSQIRTQISGSYLKITRGVADDEYRRETAQQLNVEGFIDIALFMSDRQLSVSLNAYEAQKGEIIYSRIVTSEPMKREEYLHVYLGKMTLPINEPSPRSGKTVLHQSIILGAERVVRLNQDWTSGISAAFFSDDNSKLTASEKVSGGTSGVMVDGVVGYDVVGFGSNRGAVTLNLGLGMMIATSINSPPYLKTGVSVTVAEQLTLGYNYLLMLTSTTALKLPSASYFAVGWKF